MRIALMILAMSLSFTAGVTASGDARVLAWLQQARETHRAWAEFYRLHPNEERRLVPQARCTGDRTYNLEWMARYDAMLCALGAQP